MNAYFARDSLGARSWEGVGKEAREVGERQVRVRRIRPALTPEGHSGRVGGRPASARNFFSFSLSFWTPCLFLSLFSFSLS